mmetsp:Transcript_2354/g.5990  ORF Transcript_2354/g.5990 Transcript_2354/m.5990 type:complete len:119 (+) Transcript_2354:904-1260(+)
MRKAVEAARTRKLSRAQHWRRMARGLETPAAMEKTRAICPNAPSPGPATVFFQDERLPLWQRELQPTILALLASLDHNVNVLHNHQRTLDELVDVTVAQNQQSQAHAASTLSGPPGTH